MAETAGSRSVERLAWSPKEAAQSLGLPERSVQALCQRGELPAVRIGNQWRIPVWGLQSYLARESGPDVPEVSESCERNDITSPQREKMRELKRLAAQMTALALELEES